MYTQGMYECNYFFKWTGYVIIVFLVVYIGSMIVSNNIVVVVVGSLSESNYEVSCYIQVSYVV